MPKRLTATEKWNDKWFRNLKPNQKIFWIWLTDQCDIAGTLDIDLRQAEFDIGGKVSLDDFSTRVVHVSGDRYWLPGFIEFQQGVSIRELNEDNKAHLGILRIVNKYNLLQVQESLVKEGASKPLASPLEGASEGLPSPPSIGIGIGIGKGKGTGKDVAKFKSPTLAEVESEMERVMPLIDKRAPGAAHVVRPAMEAPKFVGYYTQRDWLIRGKKIKSWQQTAYNWLLKAYEYHTERKNRER